MKLSYLLPAALLSLPLALMSCEKNSPAPQPAASSATYAEGNAAPTALPLPASTFATNVANSQANEPRRAVVLHAVLPNGQTLAITYSFLGSAFPATGSVALDAPVQIAALNAANQPGTAWQDGGSRAQLTVDSTSPKVVSGSYTGTFTAGGPVVRFTFTRLPL